MLGDLSKAPMSPKFESLIIRFCHLNISWNFSHFQWSELTIYHWVLGRGDKRWESNKRQNIQHPGFTGHHRPDYWPGPQWLNKGRADGISCSPLDMVIRGRRDLKIHYLTLKLVLFMSWLVWADADWQHLSAYQRASMQRIKAWWISFKYRYISSNIYETLNSAEVEWL